MLDKQVQLRYFIGWPLSVTNVNIIFNAFYVQKKIAQLISTKRRDITNDILQVQSTSYTSFLRVSYRSEHALSLRNDSCIINSCCYMLLRKPPISVVAVKTSRASYSSSPALALLGTETNAPIESTLEILIRKRRFWAYQYIKRPDHDDQAGQSKIGQQTHERA